MCEVTEEEYEAIDALKEQGHKTITVEMVEEWIAAKRQAEEVPQQVETETPWTSYRPPISHESASNDQQFRRRRKRGRPAKNDYWILLAAEYMAEGLTLRKALLRQGMNLTLAERKNIYRLKRFREALQHERKRLELE